VAKLELRVDISRSEIKDFDSDLEKGEVGRIEAGESIGEIEKRWVLVEEAIKE
jgi:hypothetical protein